MMIYSTAEVSAECGISQDHAKRLCQDGTFAHARKLGTCWAIPSRDVQAYQRKRTPKQAKKQAKKTS